MKLFRISIALLSLLFLFCAGNAFAGPVICEDGYELYQINARQAFCLNQYSTHEFQVTQSGETLPGVCPVGASILQISPEQYACVKDDSPNYKSCPKNKILKKINPKQAICTNPSSDDDGSDFVQETAYSSKRANDMTDNFGGFRMTFDITFGAGRWDDKFWVKTDNDWDEKGSGIGAQLQIRNSYLWGKRVFVGPTVMISGGIPMFFNGALGVEFIVPFNAKDALTATAGVGMTWRTDYLDENYYVENNDVSIRNMFFPFILSYEHVFDNHLILGLTVQFNLTIHAPEVDGGGVTFGNTPDTPEKSAAMGYFGGGVHLGYDF